ncbi:MAG TPA: DUF4430 domain-containing protein [Clostridiaceae bacterium]
MKKKMILSFFMILICAGLIFLVKGFQEKAAVVPQAGAETAQKAEATAQTAGTTKTGEAAAPVTGSSKADVSTNSVTGGKSSAASLDSGANTSTAKNSNKSSSPVVTKPEKKAADNFIVYDSARGAYLTSFSVEISEGDSVADVTMKALNGDYRASGSGDSIYFSKIMGISEKSAGAMSGWCFYVNGQKPGLSAGSYKLKSGDVVEWKFLKDGTNN